MRRIALAGLVAAVVAAFAPTARTDTTALALVRVEVDSPEQAARLFGRFDETHNHGAGEVELLLWPGDRAELDALGLDYDVVTENIYARDLRADGGPDPVVQLPGPDRSDYRRLGDYNSEMERLAKKNPSLVEFFEMPRDSLEGRPIYGVEIAADVTDDDGRPIFYVDGVHHAREWPASEYTMIFAHYLVDRFGKDPKITSLLKRARVIAVPIVNVDGFDYSRESVFSANQTVADETWPMAFGNGFEGYWRKNRRSLTGVTVPVAQRNPDAYGVDPNRNYAYLWGDQEGGSSGNQLDQTYRGAAPFSEPETQNVRDLVLSRSVTGVITNHTYQGSVLRAGGGSAPDDALLTRIGDRLAQALGGYANRPTVGYPTTGTTDDWAYAAIGSLGFTIEHGEVGFHPPYADEVGEESDNVMKAFSIMLDVAADPAYHSILSGRVAGGPAKLTLTKTFQTPLSPGNPTGERFVTEKVRMELETERDGSFEWHIGPSTRPWAPSPEVYTLVIEARGETKKMRVSVDRGEHLKLGTIRL